MATVAELMVKINGNTAGLERALSGIDGKMRSALQGSQMVAGGLIAAAAAAGVLGIKAVSLAMDMEQTEVAFSTLLGSGEAATKMMEDLNAFAATTPFQFPELAKGAKLLAAFGVETEQIIPSMQRLGDVSAGIGAPIAEIAEIYGKAKVQGRLFMEDINQLTGRGIPIIGELAKQFGVTEAEIRDLVSSGQVNFGHLEQAFIDLTSEGGKFEGMMEAQSQTLGGLWSTVKDNITLSLAGIGTTIIEAFDLKGKAAGLIESLSTITERINEFATLVSEVGIKEALGSLFSEETKIKIMVIGGAILGALVPAAYAAAAAFFAMMIPLLPFIIAGAVLGALAYLIFKQWDFLKGFFTNFWSTITGKWDETKAWFIGLWTSIKDFFSKTWESIKSIFSNALQAVVDFIKTRFDNAKNNITTVWNAVKDFFSETWENIKSIFTNALQAVVDFIRTRFDNIKTNATNVWTTIKDFIVTIWDNIKSSITTKAQEIYTNAKTKLEEIWSYIKGIPAQALQWGKDIISGLWDGMKSIFSGIKSWFENNVMSLLNKLNPWAKHSPSLIDNIRSGVSEIEGIYKSLRLPDMSLQPNIALAGGGSVSGSMGGGSQTIIIELDGRQIGRSTFKHLPGEIRIKTGLKN